MTYWFIINLEEQSAMLQNPKTGGVTHSKHGSLEGGEVFG